MIKLLFKIKLLIFQWKKVTLFDFESDNIKIYMGLYFTQQNQLIFDGYDIGKTVDIAFGDSDYEYGYVIDTSEVKKLYNFYNIKEIERLKLLNTLQVHFSGNKAYSKFARIFEGK